MALGLIFSASMAGAAESNLSGQVADPDGLGLGGVQVKVFVNGFLKGATVSGADGGYDVTFKFDDLGDDTTVVWFVATDETSPPEIVILRESVAAKEAGLWSPCLPRVDIGTSISYDATIYSEDAKFEALGQSDCF
jgi:hypothetical protein